MTHKLANAIVDVADVDVDVVVGFGEAGGDASVVVGGESGCDGRDVDGEYVDIADGDKRGGERGRMC